MAPKRDTAMELWGKELAHAREAAGLTGKQLAEAINVAPSTVGMWETGKRTPHPDDLRRCEEKLGTNGYLARILAKWVSREVSPEWLEWMEVEEKATELLTFQVTLIPGLLQQEDYARAVLSTEDRVAQRMERQLLLEHETPPLLVALLDESILYRMVGNAKIMTDQLTHLASMAEREDIFVHIVPLTANVCAKFAGPFVIASVDGGGSQVAFVDAELGGRIVERSADLSVLRRKWERFRAEALPKQASIDLIRKTVNEQWSIA